jgi:hypothetical protein
MTDPEGMTPMWLSFLTQFQPTVWSCSGREVAYRTPLFVLCFLLEMLYIPVLK